MSKKTAGKKKEKSLLTEQSMNFLKNYINTPSPVGFESGGQKVWMEYMKPYIDTFITDPYGTAVGVINPTAPFKIVLEAHADECFSNKSQQVLKFKRFDKDNVIRGVL